CLVLSWDENREGTAGDSLNQDPSSHQRLLCIGECRKDVHAIAGVEWRWILHSERNLRLHGDGYEVILAKNVTATQVLCVSPVECIRSERLVVQLSTIASQLDVLHVCRRVRCST